MGGDEGEGEAFAEAGYVVSDTVEFVTDGLGRYFLSAMDVERSSRSLRRSKTAVSRTSTTQKDRTSRSA